jgi:DNA (cytosine-5)-methyltransferase 1
MKVLNLYACLGGNRYKWGNDHEITAVELDPELARMYKERFPNDTVIVTDAHQFLLEHYKEYDFIWTSPPCPSHSRAAFGSRKSEKAAHKPIFPDLKLYEEVLFLEHYFDGKYCVENVIPYYEPLIPYYEPLIPAQKRGRHLYWTNFTLPYDLGERKSVNMESINEVDQWCQFHEYDFRRYKGEQRINKIARNLVDFEAGKTILDTALGIMRQSNYTQAKLF